jgi:hypothetical protein
MSRETRRGEESLSQHNSELPLNRQELANQLFQKVNTFLEEYIAESVDVLTDQVGRIIESIKKDNTSRRFKFQADHVKIHSTVARVLELKKSTLNKELRKRLETLKLEINELCIDKARNVVLKVEELVNFDLFFQKTKEILRGFDTFCIELKAKLTTLLNEKKPVSSEQELVLPSLERLTDFMSDTESTQQAAFLSDRKCKYFVESMKKYKEGLFTAYDDREDEDVKGGSLTRSLSESDLACFDVVVVSKKHFDDFDADDELDPVGSMSSFTGSIPNTSWNNLFKSSDSECEVAIL